ncbi:MAG: DUF3560 domain-containing protein [Clostridiales Family XIII bacterium]|jgi:hypothetical protein|nr:DUF3560 domain-containing protein [Clostridiales Family XIII bacterium]
MAIGRNDYEERKEARIDRLNDMATALNIESNQKLKRAEKLSERFYMGQPIIVGHHSEKSARNTQKKMWATAEKALDLQDKADVLAAKAEAATQNTAISSDDPDAMDKLEAKLAKLEQNQEFMKAANAHWRKHKTMKGFRDITDEGAAKIDEQMKTAYMWVQKNGPCESFRLSNNNANIKRLKDRLAQLQALDEMPAGEISFDGGKIIVDIDENRVKICFDERQGDEKTAVLKGRGFKWSRNNQCWQRLRTKNALWAAKRICGVSDNAGDFEEAHIEKD